MGEMEISTPEHRVTPEDRERLIKMTLERVNALLRSGIEAAMPREELIKAVDTELETLLTTLGPKR